MGLRWPHLLVATTKSPLAGTQIPGIISVMVKLSLEVVDKVTVLEGSELGLVVVVVDLPVVTLEVASVVDVLILEPGGGSLEP